MKRNNIVLIHLLFWFYIINQALFPLYIGQLDEKMLMYNTYLKEVSISVLLNMISFYTVYGLFPYFMKVNKRALVILTAIILLALITAFRVVAEFYVWKIFMHEPGKEMVFKTIYVWNNLRLVIVTGIYAVLIRFMINWFESQKLRDELINQQQASELALMRSQVNPHFLFNTLNNIYSLVYRKSVEAPEAVMKLSSIMRYMLYDSSAREVQLEKEIEYLQSFIELQNMRIKSPDFVSLRIEGNTEGLTIAPMLLISFVENAFKHSCKNHRPGIRIHLSVINATIFFEVINYIKNSSAATEEPTGGISLGTIKRRLELIYPGKHTLTIIQDTEIFTITLEITP